MQIGRLRHRLRIDRPANVSDGAGGEVTVWQTLATVHAEILPTGGGKFEEGDIVTVGQQRYKVRLRYRDDVTVDCRCVWLRPDALPDVPLRIDSIADMDGRSRVLQAFMTAGVPT